MTATVPVAPAPAGTAPAAPSATDQGGSANQPSGREGSEPADVSPRPESSATDAPGQAPRTDDLKPASPAAPASAAISAPQPQSTGTSDTSPAASTPGSWLRATASQVIEEVREALREVTLKDLAIAALPGLAGILFFFVSGIGIGHRQARFGFSIESTGALRFAAGGPMGVVRPGGFIAVPGRAAKRSTSSRRLRVLPTADRAA